MSIGNFLGIQPSELKFPFELRKQSSCCMQLANKTDQYIAFKVKTTNPKKYCVRPNAGIVLPNSTCNVTVTMQAPKEDSTDMQCRDKFLVQSVVAPTGATSKDVTPEMFNREDGKVVDEFRIRVVYIPANPPSPVPEGDEEGTSSGDDEIKKTELSEAVKRSLKQVVENSSSETGTAVVSKLNEEIASVLKQNEKLLAELEIIRKQSRQGKTGGASFVVLVFCLLLSIFLGYMIRKYGAVHT